MEGPLEGSLEPLLVARCAEYSARRRVYEYPYTPSQRANRVEDGRVAERPTSSAKTRVELSGTTRPCQCFLSVPEDSAAETMIMTTI